MGRKKQMVKQLIENKRAQLRKIVNEEKERMEEKAKEISEEEHQKRLQRLREIGLLK